MRRRRADESPFDVRVSQALFPVALLTLTVSVDSVAGVEVNQAHLDEFLKARSGDGGPTLTLARGDSLDVFVHGTNSFETATVPGLARTFAFPLSSRLPLHITVTWEPIGGHDKKGQLGILWTHEDLTSGRAPFIAYGPDADQLEKFTRIRSQRLSGSLLLQRSRVKPLRRRDVTRRVAFENKETSMHAGHAPVRIDYLEVEGYRGFRTPGRLRLARPDGETPGSGLTIVVGANNSGKSTIWECFDAVARKRNGDVSFSEGRRNHGTEDGIRITMAFADGPAYVVQSQSANTSETKAMWLPSQPHPEPLVEIVSVPSRRYFQASFGKNMTTQRDWMSHNQDFSRYQERDQFTGRLFELHNDETKKARFDKLVEEVVGEPVNWSIDLSDGQFGSNYYLKVTTANGVVHSSEGLGDGIISLLFILDSLYDSQPHTVVVIDEPELSLHPQLVRRLGRVIARYSIDHQIVVLTHSPLLVSWDDIAAGAEIARVFKTGPDSHIAQVDRGVVAGVSKARGGWKNPHVLGHDANEALFLDDEIIVVEGQEDAGLLPVVFDQAGVDRRGTVFGWGSGGGDGGPKRIVALLDALGFTKVVALLDADKPDEVDAIQAEFPHYFATTIPADDIRDKPAGTFKGKVGLLDEKGKSIKEPLLDDTRAVLRSVHEYFDKPE